MHDVTKIHAIELVELGIVRQMDLLLLWKKKQNCIDETLEQYLSWITDDIKQNLPIK